MFGAFYFGQAYFGQGISYTVTVQPGGTAVGQAVLTGPPDLLVIGQRLLSDSDLEASLTSIMFDVDFRTVLTDVATYSVDGVSGIDEIITLYEKNPRMRAYLSVPLILNNTWQGSNWKQAGKGDAQYLRYAFIRRYGNVNRRTSFKPLSSL